MTRSRPLGILVLALAACGVGEPPAASTDPDPRIAQVFAGLQPAVQLEGEPRALYGLEERMEHYRVPGVGIAVLDGDSLAWAAGFGTADRETGRAAGTATLFQAASISKPVAALVALSLVEEGLLDLDAPVNRYLSTWRLPGNEFTADSAVTLRGLLTHSAGTTVWGFPGYRKDRPFRDGQPIADNAQVLDGEGNTDPVRVYKVPGTSWQYSGGGFTIMEQMVEDVTGLPFEEAARIRVLEPAGMTRSTYAQPLPENRWPEAARGHRSDGSEVDGEWHTYPEQAAAGLWTTPEDLVKLSAHLNGILSGRVTDGVVSRATLEAMLTPHQGGAAAYRGWGLGIALEGAGETATYAHGGSNEGFKAQWFTYRDRGQGVAIMTNGDRGSALAAEILRAVAAGYGWPDFQAEVRARATPDSAALADLEGTYRLDEEPEVELVVGGDDGVLLVDVPGQGTFTLHAWADSTDVFFDRTDGRVLRFERDADGAVTAARQGENLFPRR